MTNHETLSALIGDFCCDATFKTTKGLDGGFGGEAPSGSERVAFAQLIDRVFLLARSFNFTVPPYFISNVRALGKIVAYHPLYS